MPNLTTPSLRLQLEPPVKATDAGAKALLRADPATGALCIEQAGHVAYLHTPTNPTGPLPLLVVLHGAGKNKFWNLRDQVANWAQRAKAHNMLVLFPAAAGSTWDYIASKRTQRRDFDFLQFAINTIRKAFPVDDRRIAITGISDGGSMALSLGVHNPDVFQAIMSASAGFCVSPPFVDGQGRRGPKVFMQHGSHDGMFPLERVGIPLQDKLKRAGHNVDFRIAKGQGHVPAGWQEEFVPAWLAMGAK